MKINGSSAGLLCILLACLCVCIVSGQAQAPVAVELRNSSYHPPTVTVEPGTTVLWTNYDTVSHSVTSMTGLFDSGALETGESFNYTFDEPGTYAYGCRINQSLENTRMPGRIVVVAGVTGNMTGTEADTVVQVIEGNQNLTVLARALNATNLTGNLSAGGPFTVFAPTDTAFAALGNGTVEELLNDTANATPILQYHIVPGLYTSQQLMNMTETGNATLPTLLGENVTITREGGAILINNATVNATDINADNGIVHTIDAVLIPPANMTAVQEPVAAVTARVTEEPVVNETPVITATETMTEEPVMNETPAITAAPRGRY